MTRKRPWQVLRCIVTETENIVSSRSYVTERQALHAAIEWVESMAPHLDIHPDASVHLKDADVGADRDDDLLPQSYRVALDAAREVRIHVYPPRTAAERDRLALDAMSAVIRGEKPVLDWIYPEELPQYLR